MIRTVSLLLVFVALVSRDARARQALPSQPAVRLAPIESRRAPDSLLVRAGKTTRVTRALALPADPSEDRVFRVQQPLSGEWSPRSFTLVVDRDTDPASDGYEHVRFWVDATDWADGVVPQDPFQALVEAATTGTPADPASGILAITTGLFGPPPDTDGDGALDVLLFDIVDDHQSPSGNLVLGYFSPADYDDTAPTGAGNGADVLYMDTDPQLTEFAAITPETFAGIQARQSLYSIDRDEDGFVGRGLTEWPRILAGYPGPGRYYLEFAEEHGIGFFYWSDAAAYVGDVQRATLFVNYLSEQLGTGFVSELVREPADGPDGLRAVLSRSGDGRSLEQLVFDFHTANFVNDPDLGPRFAHRNPAYRDRSGSPTYLIDAGTIESLQPLPITFNGGGVQYVTWENVSDLAVRIGAPDGVSVRARMVLESVDGVRSMQTFDAGDTERFEGRFERATAILFLADLDDPTARSTLTVDGSWDDTAVATTYVGYDDGTISDPAHNFARLGAAWEQSTRFEVPEGQELFSVYLSPFFANQFFQADGETPVGTPFDPRDFTLRIRADSLGLPGRLLYETVLEDPRGFEYAGESLRHFEVPLHAFPGRPLGLPSAIHVGMAEAGSDDNDLIFTVADYDVENVSFVSGPIEGIQRTLPVWETTLGSHSLEGTMVPIRVQFRAVSTALEPGPAYAESGWSLFPNPAATRVQIRLDAVEGQPRTVTVHDVIGRQVARITLPSGEDQGIVDLGGLAPGLYVASSPGLPARPFVVAR